MSAQTTVEGLKSVFRILDRIGLTKDICVTTSEPQSLVSPAHEKAVDNETNEATLEEMASMLSASGVLIALLASAAGMAIIAAQRSVLSADVMIALALVPAMSIVGMGMATGELGLAGKGLMRWAVDAACVLAAGALVLSVKRAVIHRRVSLN